MDRKVEFFFANKIREHYPNHYILAEEGYGDQTIDEHGTIWIIDPIDGTMNFVHQKRNFAISVGIYHRGVGEIGLIYDVEHQNLYYAIRGGGAYKNELRLNTLDKMKTLQTSIICLNHRWLTPNRLVEEKVMHRLVKHVRGTRSYGSAALELSYVAEGIVDAYITMRLQPWDIAAGSILLNEVGGVITDISGQPIALMEGSPVLACNPAIQDDLLEEFLIAGKKK